MDPTRDTQLRALLADLAGFPPVITAIVMEYSSAFLNSRCFGKSFWNSTAAQNPSCCAVRRWGVRLNLRPDWTGCLRVTGHGGCRNTSSTKEFSWDVVEVVLKKPACFTLSILGVKFYAKIRWQELSVGVVEFGHLLSNVIGCELGKLPPTMALQKNNFGSGMLGSSTFGDLLAAYKQCPLNRLDSYLTESVMVVDEFGHYVETKTDEVAIVNRIFWRNSPGLRQLRMHDAMEMAIHDNNLGAVFVELLATGSIQKAKIPPIALPEPEGVHFDVEFDSIDVSGGFGAAGAETTCKGCGAEFDSRSLLMAHLKQELGPYFYSGLRAVKHAYADVRAKKGNSPSMPPPPPPSQIGMASYAADAENSNDVNCVIDDDQISTEEKKVELKPAASKLSTQPDPETLEVFKKAKQVLASWHHRSAGFLHTQHCKNTLLRYIARLKTTNHVTEIESY